MEWNEDGLDIACWFVIGLAIIMIVFQFARFYINL